MTLLAAWSFDEASGDVLDVTGNGHDLALGAGARVTGHTGSGLTVTTSGETNRPNSAPFGLSAARTVMCWYVFPSLGSTSRWAVEWHNNAGNTGIWGLIWGLSADTVAVRARNAGSAVSCTAPRPSLGEWHHYAGTYDGTNLRMYVDGVLAATTPLAGPLRTDADAVWLMDGSATQDAIDGVRVFDEALDAAAVTSWMNTPVTSTPSTTPVGVDGAAAWNVRGTAGADGAAGWNTRALAGVAAAASWTVRQLAAVTGSGSWNVRALTGVGGAASWRVRAVAGAAGMAAWATRVLAGVTGRASWDVDGVAPTTPAHRTLAVRGEDRALRVPPEDRIVRVTP